MEANKRRKIRNGKEFAHLFPSPSEEDRTIKGSASVEDTMALIKRTVPLTLWHTERIAKKLKGRTLEETCRNVWRFVYDHIQYKRDKDGVEQVRSPRRTWHERETGVDCDCYTEFISSILLNLNIPHKARITKYPKKYPEVPRWQHVYPIVPKHGRWHRALTNRDDYIVLDCVKDDFDDEQEYLECKDYDMRLDYLDGIEEEETHDQSTYEDDFDYAEPDNVDLADLASIYDDEEMGNIFKKIGGAVKKVAQKVGGAVKTVAQDIKRTAPVLAKKVSDDVGKGVRFLNRYTNPATILLRNGFLLAMKINLFNVAGRLRYAYLTDAKAQAKSINLSELRKLRTIKDRAETVYWQAGGKKENLKKAILSGKGNSDRKVPLSGLDGIDGNVYADEDEYNIIHSDDMEGLGEIASGTAIAAATSAVAAIAAALKQVKGLFSKGGNEEQAFQSETDNAGSASSAPAMISEDEDAITNQAFSEARPSSSTSLVQKIIPAIKQIAPLITPAKAITPAAPVVKPIAPPKPVAPPKPIVPASPKPLTVIKAQESKSTASAQIVPSQSAVERRAPSVPDTQPTSTALQTQDSTPGEGIMQKSTTWIKENPGKSLLFAGGLITGGFLLSRALRGQPNNTNKGLNGPPPQRKKKKYKRKNKKRNKVKPINLL